MPDIIEIGLDVLESVQPEAANMNPYELKKNGEIKLHSGEHLAVKALFLSELRKKSKLKSKNYTEKWVKAAGIFWLPQNRFNPELL